MTRLERLGRNVLKATPGVRRFYRSEHAPRLHGYVRDQLNRARFGAQAPQFAERLWIDPFEVHSFDRRGTVWNSAYVETGEWRPQDEQPIECDPILRSSVAHWVHGIPWEETGEIERMERAIRELGPLAGCSTRADILRRCALLDEIFATVRREGRIRPQAEVEPGTYRELGGVGVHVGPGGRLIRAGNGRHRFAMARILGIRPIPVRVGVVHHSALPLLPVLRDAQTTRQVLAT